jgi:hypothetical protein
MLTSRPSTWDKLTAMTPFSFLIMCQHQCEPTINWRRREWFSYPQKPQ